MNRRDFLKISALLSAALIVQISPLGIKINHPVEVEAENKIYRGTLDGKIYVSEDERKTWLLHANFGSQFSILHLGKNLWGQVQAKLGFGEHDIHLTLSENNVQWKTN